MVAVTTYTVSAKRSGTWWALSVPDVPGALSQAKRLDQAPAMIREAIALMLGVAEDSFDVTLDVQLPGDELAELREVKARQQEAERAQLDAAAKTRALVARLRSDGLTTRDIGTILGVSQQRAHQLLESKTQAS